MNDHKGQQEDNDHIEQHRQNVFFRNPRIILGSDFNFDHADIVVFFPCLWCIFAKNIIQIFFRSRLDGRLFFYGLLCRLCLRFRKLPGNIIRLVKRDFYRGNLRQWLCLRRPAGSFAFVRLFLHVFL